MGRGVILDTIQIGTLSFVTVASFITNSLLLCVSLCDRKTQLTSGDLLMAALAVADMLWATGIPVTLLADFELLGDGLSMLCVAANSACMSIPILTLLMLLALTAERCINIFAPLRAVTIVTRKRVLVVILAGFSYGTVLTLLMPLFGNSLEVRKELNSNNTDCNFATVSVAPLVGFMLLGNLIPGMLLLVVLNGAIFCVAHKHLHKISDFHPSVLTREKKLEIANYRKQKGRSNAVMFVCQLYVLAYFPVALALFIDFQGFEVYVIEEWRAPFMLYAGGMFMASLSTVVFPVILIKSNSQYKDWIRVKVLRRKREEIAANHSSQNVSRNPETKSKTDDKMNIAENRLEQTATNHSSPNVSRDPKTKSETDDKMNIAVIRFEKTTTNHSSPNVSRHSNTKTETEDKMKVAVIRFEKTATNHSSPSVSRDS
ncbi:adenosine receptor A2b-like [Littorina saxatilis]|uniref:G-protein coupled receptors family 1 profile domain-containing protein n=1 Tax=Littorina saxatilis TaxID=31220 RepID=A0AAN9APH3_9CAEN